MNKDVLFSIYEIVHRDLTKQLNAEYCKKVWKCNCWNNVCTSFIKIKFDGPRCRELLYNYRSFEFRWDVDYFDHVHTKYGIRRCGVPKKY